MNKSKYTNYNDLPLMLSVPDVASVLGISRAGAYELVRSDGFPALRIGSRIVVPKERFIDWINANTGAKKLRRYIQRKSVFQQNPLDIISARRYNIKGDENDY